MADTTGTSKSLQNTLLSGLCAIAALSAPGFPTPAAATEGQDRLIEHLDKKYGKPGISVTRFVNRVAGMDNEGGADGTAFSVEGRKDDGSYWWSAAFNAATGKTFFKPRKNLARLCDKSGGAFTRETGGGGGILDATTDKAVRERAMETNWMTPELAMVWRRSGQSPEKIEAYRRQGYVQGMLGSNAYRNYGWVRDVFAEVERDGAFGMFACEHGDPGQNWRVAVLPTLSYSFQTLAERSRGMFSNSWIALAITPVLANVRTADAGDTSGEPD
ncbi:MAG: hypothetical protein WA979_02480 [Pacificimonas sp.]